MKQQQTYRLILLALWLICVMQAHAKAFPERIVLLSDRSLYITGERVHFTALVLPGNEIVTDHLSKVVYVEVITPEGRSVAKGKFPVENQASAGYLEIPAETVTGVYYLRAYTRIMRNDGPEIYSYLGIRVVNPYKNEVLHGDGTITSRTAEPDNNSEWLKLSPVKDSYAAGEQISIATELHSAGITPFMVNISVIPKRTYSRIPIVPSKSSRNKIPSELCSETRGLSISGVLKTAENGQPVTNQRINLSVIGEGKDFMAMNSDAEGRFYFSLPALSGWRDLYLGTTGTGTQQARVFADNDFCTLPVYLPAPAFALNEEERRVVVAMAGNTRVNGAFRDSVLKAIPLPVGPFYGTPDQVLVLSKFVELPSLEEYFNELSGLIKVRTNGGRKFFKVTGIQPEMAIYEPLVLIDHVAVDDFEELLSAPPSLIDRIEMFNQPYLKGEIIYGGIVSIISKRGDFAGIDLPVSGTFINYRFFNELEDEDFKPDAASPDARNTVFFGIIPQQDTDKYKPVTVIAPSTSGTYEVIISIIDKDGNVTESTREFSVN